MLCKVYFGLYFYLVRLVILREQPVFVYDSIYTQEELLQLQLKLQLNQLTEKCSAV
jgi:hypothetical protein